MKIYSAVSIFILILSVLGCNKNDNVVLPVPPPGTGADDARMVLLKDIVADHLPSPYFHFEYDDQHYAKKISFASDLFVYNVEYHDKRVTRMVNLPNQNSLEYSYNNGHVSEINEFSGTTGNMVYNYAFLYNSRMQLTHVFWITFDHDPGGNIFKRADLAYLPDSNLASINLYYAANPGDTLTWTSRDEFSDYDNQTNVDDIAVLKDFFGTFLFLPQVKLQKNNPLKEHITSATNEYLITNTYAYQNNLPVTKTSSVDQIRGGTGGGPVQVATHYTYY